MNDEKSENSLLTNILQVTLQKPSKVSQNISKEKLTFLDSTAVTGKLAQDSTLDSNILQEGTSLDKNFNPELSTTEFLDVRKSTSGILSSQIPNNSFNISIPLEKKYEQFNSSFIEDEKDADLELIEKDQLQVNPK